MSSNQYFNTILDFIASIQDAQTVHDLSTRFGQTIAGFGFGFYTCISHPKPVDRALPTDGLSTYPQQWVTHYLDRHYFNQDVFASRAAANLQPFDWSDLCNRNTLTVAQKTVMGEFSEIGLAKGLTVPIHVSPESPASCSLSSGTENYDADATGTVTVLAMYFFNAMKALAKPTGSTKPNIVQLAKRERECLEFAARGKTTWEISCILGIAERTVITHLENARRRLNAVNRTHAVAKAICLRSIDVAGMHRI